MCINEANTCHVMIAIFSSKDTVTAHNYDKKGLWLKVCNVACVYSIHFLKILADNLSRNHIR